jgi:hypothetical protein
VHTDPDEQLRTLSLSFCADYFGVADLSSAHDFIVEQGGEWIAG